MACEDKNKYSKREAEKMKTLVGREKDKSMRVYECPECHHYHLTKKGGKY